ncbi:MAG: FIST C-terminal domain-containing protein [Treponema sp.]|jgi:hypothetical protein|nr:FIST C-terminal domain-containing protein [Treponema sp.]
MMQTITIHTSEIDDPEAAVAELLAQLETKGPLLAHSVGLVTCFADFISAGIVEDLAKKLPFEILGTTTIAGASESAAGEVLLFLTVLTGDDVEFVAGLTDPIGAEDIAPISAAWEKAAAGRAEKPALMLSFAPLLTNVSGDFFADAFSAVSGNVPNFGTLAVDHNADYHESMVIFNGAAYPDRYGFILCYGKIKPLFFVGGLSEKRAFRGKGVVTASAGNQLEGVNGISVADYLSGLGLKKGPDGALKGINAYPFILDYNDGTQPVIRVMFAITPEGHAVCGGNMPVGASLQVGVIDAAEVLSVTEETIKSALAIGQNNGMESGAMLIFSCVGRYFAQGFHPEAEMQKAQEILKGKASFHLSYSGTELCPVYGQNGSTRNRSHNDSIVICMF